MIPRLTSHLALLLLFVNAVSFAGDPSLPALFAKAKQEFQQGKHKESLSDLDRLDVLSQQPGNEADRKQLDPVITFYRGANFAALGDKEQAKNTFIAYLAMVPKAKLEPKSYAKEVIDAFNEARQDVGLGVDNSLATEFAEFHPAGTLPIDANWAETPVRYLLSRDEKRQWSTLRTDEERTTFVEAFWKKLDPTPDDADNPIRREFERRIRFAELKFGSEKHPGSQSDRAIVFALFGPPSYVGVARPRAGDDKVESMRGGTNNSRIADAMPAPGTTVSVQPLRGRFTGMGTITGTPPANGISNDLERGIREAWYYRKGRLASAMRYADLHVDFFTREGYGTGIMQRDPEILQALGQAADLMLKAKALN